jgi:hypothetical protein
VAAQRLLQAQHLVDMTAAAAEGELL